MKSIIKKYEGRIVGTTPVIWNRMKKELTDEQKKLKKDEFVEWEEQNWIRKAEINDGNAILPPEWIRSGLIRAAKYSRYVPHFATSKKETYTRYMESIIVPPKPPIILCKKKALEPDGKFMPSQGRQGGGKVWKVFPILKEWNATFTIVDPFGRMKTEELTYLLEYNGLYIGIGDQRTWNFGRFEIDYVKEIKHEEKKGF